MNISKEKIQTVLNILSKTEGFFKSPIPLIASSAVGAAITGDIIGKAMAQVANKSIQQKIEAMHGDNLVSGSEALAGSGIKYIGSKEDLDSTPFSKNEKMTILKKIFANTPNAAYIKKDDGQYVAFNSPQINRFMLAHEVGHSKDNAGAFMRFIGGKVGEEERAWNAAGPEATNSPESILSQQTYKNTQLGRNVGLAAGGIIGAQIAAKPYIQSAMRNLITRIIKK